MEKKIETGNGPEIYWYPNCHTHSFCLSLYIRAGCIYESGRDNGITHFMEHMVFRSINRHMDGRMYQILDEKGLYFNGATYKEFIQLYIIGAPQHFTEAADILLKVFEPFCLSAEDIGTEQQRVKSEIREAGDLKSLDHFAGTFVWENTNTANTILGTKGNVSRFTGKRMESYRKDVLRRGNVFLYVTGNVSEKDIGELSEKAQRCRLSAERTPENNCVEVPCSFMARPCRVYVKSSEYYMVQFSFDFMTKRYTTAELALLYDILFSGENSLVHQELSEKRGWIYSYTSALEKYSNIGRIYFSYEIGKKRLQDSVALVFRALSALLDEETLSERLLWVLPEYTDNAYMIYDDNEGFNWQRAYECHIMGEDYKTIEAGKSAFEAVTPRRLLQIVKEIFRRENLVLSMKGRKQQIDTAGIEELIAGFGRTDTKTDADCLGKDGGFCES